MQLVTQVQEFITANPLVLAAAGGLAAAVLDFIFAIKPSWKSNGVLHFFYNLLSKKKA